MAENHDNIPHQTKVISKIHHQLATDFHPAFKNVATAAMAFNKSQEANQRAFAEYLISLNKLVVSAKNAEPDAQATAQELKELIPKFRKIGEETSKLIDEFGEIACKIHLNAEAEKENHRKVLNDYLKQQRQIHKDVNKKRKSNKDLREFYNKKYNDTINLQCSRYKYFTDSHLKLLKRTTEVWNELSGGLPNTGKTTEAKENGSQKTESKSAETTSQNEKPEARTTMSNHSSRRDEMPSQAFKREEISRPLDIVMVTDGHDNDLMTPVSQQIDTITGFLNEYNSEGVPTLQTNKSNRSSSRPPYSRQQSDVGGNYQQRPNLQNIYFPPSTPTPPLPRHQPVQPPPRETSIQSFPQPEHNGFERINEDSLLIPVSKPYTPAFNDGYIPVNQFEVTSPPESQMKRSAPPPPPQEIQPLPPPQRQQVSPPQFHPAPPPQFQPPQFQPPPSPPPPAPQKPAFTAADYGSVVTCTMPYTARTPKQISLAAGDNAQLIRCGQRGWVLLRTLADPNRVGWFPAKFVRHENG